jgi:hypothetical protein
MFAWIAENSVTLAAIAAVLVLAGIAVLSLVKDKKNKKGVCTGNCASCGAGCPYSKKQ